MKRFTVFRTASSVDPAIAVGWLLLPALLLWDLSGGDMPLARLFGGPAGFALRDNVWLAGVAHEGGRLLAWALVLLLSLSVWWPVGPLRRLSQAERLQWTVSTLVALLVVVVIKRWSGTSCPYDMAAFGGSAQWMPHWRGFLHADGGGGHCFPAGHASSGFAFIGGHRALRHRWPRAARWVLGVSIAAGLLLGLGQQARGAHFMSHTLWTGWLCWAATALVDRVWPRAAPGFAAPVAMEGT